MKYLTENLALSSYNNKEMFSGSEIRGPVSSIFEALTNSCFRVFEEKRYLSRRMEADPSVLRDFQPGMVVKDSNHDSKQRFKILAFNKNKARVPFYVDKNNPFDLLSQREITKEQIYGQKPIQLWVKERVETIEYISLVPPIRDGKKWMQLNGNLEKINNNKYKIEFVWNGKKMELDNVVRNYEEDVFKDILDGKISFWAKIENKPLFKASFKEIDGWEKKSGYIKFSGPNKVEIDSESEVSEDFQVYQGLPTEPEQVCVNGEKLEGKNKIQVFRCKEKDTLYTMSKSYEAFFYYANDRKQRKYPITDNAVLERYRLLIESYKNNPQKPPEIFRSYLTQRKAKEYLMQGDLIYFKLDDSKRCVEEIIPVTISRTVDSAPLGLNMESDSLRPCEREILEDINTDSLTAFSEKYLFRRHKDGLCPACRLFGTTSYKGRVRFGFAKLQGEARWLMNEDQNGNRNLTLPLLEKPRPTWSMPEKDSEVPGRKFYVHHNGWQGVKSKSPLESKTENNRTVEPLDKYNEFKFEVFFENLEEWELGLLLYSLELEDGMAHKIGMGKAHGFGSVKIEVKNISLRDNPNEWIDATKCKNEWLQKGFEKLKESDWFGDDWYKVQHIHKLRCLLKSQDVPEGLNVRYPKLRRKDDTEERLPGYVELKDKALDWRHDYLINPWRAWLAYENGIVKWFDNQKGMGRITKSDGSEIFVSIDEIKNGQVLTAGQKVKFFTGKNDKGLCTWNVETIE